MVSYDALIIVTFAERLYKQADSIAVTFAIVGALAGAAIGAAVATNLGGSGLVGLAIGAVVIGAVALNIGEQKAFSLKLQAQIALCQVQIEANTARG
jgi:uncharacterized membrane protein